VELHTAKAALRAFPNTAIRTFKFHHTHASIALANYCPSAEFLGPKAF
jgi:hypothetical protein